MRINMRRCFKMNNMKMYILIKDDEIKKIAKQIENESKKPMEKIVEDDFCDE